MTDVRAIVCHHTAGPAAGNAPSLGVVQNGRSDLPGPLSHFLLARDGTVYVVAAGLCYHAGAVLNSNWGNAHAIGIEAEATGTSSWPEAQLAAFAKLCRALQDAFGAPVLGHKEICSPKGRKIDPNFDMNAFRGRVATADQEDDVQLTDKVRLWDDSQVEFGKVVAGIFGRLAEMYPVLTDEIPSAVAGSTYKAKPPAYWANADSYGHQANKKLDDLTAAVGETNTQLAQLVKLLTPKAES